MTVYRCFFSDKVGTQMGWKSIPCSSDFGARKSVMALLRERSEISRVEVWRESDLAFRLSRIRPRRETTLDRLRPWTRIFGSSPRIT